jgi:hypothetical protein
MTMATVNSEQSAENTEYVRRLLEQKQPGFSAALESTVDLVGGDRREGAKLKPEASE